MSEWQRIVGSIWRMPRAILAALLATWSGVMLALWLAPFGALIFLLILFIQPSNSATSALLFTVHTGGVVNLLTIAAALAAGAIAGFVAIYALIIASQPTQLASAILSGAIAAALISWIAMRVELRLLLWRGYRTPSRREFDEHIAPAVAEIMQAMELDSGVTPLSLPTILISDTPVPQAWTHANTIVVTKGLIEGLDPPEFQAVLGHEFCHWRMGDGVALRMVWALSWPLALLYNVGNALAGGRQNTHGKGGGQGVTVTQRPNFLTVLVWIVLWPVAFLIRFVLVPLAAYEGRRSEYEADAGVAAMGMGDALVRAFEQLPPFEAGRTAWEDALARTHPPLEHRIDFLQRLGDTATLPAAPTPPTTRNLRLVLAGALVLLVIALLPLVTETGKGKGTVAPAVSAAQPPSTTSPTPSETTATTSTGREATTSTEGEGGGVKLSAAESAGTDTAESAVGAAATFASSFYNDMLNEEQYSAAIYAAAAPNAVAKLISQANAQFAAKAKAVAHDTVTLTASVLAHKLVSATPQQNPTTATVDLWVTDRYVLNGGTPHVEWETVPYALIWNVSYWKVSSIPAASPGPSPAELHGAPAPPGFTLYAAPPKG